MADSLLLSMLLCSCGDVFAKKSHFCHACTHNACVAPIGLGKTTGHTRHHISAVHA